MKKVSSLRSKRPGVYRLRKDLPVYQRVNGEWEPSVVPAGHLVVRTEKGYTRAVNIPGLMLSGRTSFATAYIKQRRA